MKLAIKVDVDTYRGTKEGVISLCKVFSKYNVPATFLFSLGPDNTGKALRRIFRKGFLKKCLRSNVAGNYGLKTLMYGTILPAPKIGKLCAQQMREAADEFECGIHSWNHFKWQDYLFDMRATEVANEFECAVAEFEKILGKKAQTCGAPGWQISPDALEIEDKNNLLYASDSRGEFAFIPKMGGRTFKTPQIPSTLLTLDEVLGDTPIEDVAQLHLDKIKKNKINVMTVHSELEGMAYLNWFDDFLANAKSQDVQFFNLADYANELKEKGFENLPVCEIKMSEFTGRSGLLAVQQS